MRKIIILLMALCMFACLFACESEPVNVPVATGALERDFSGSAYENIDPATLSLSRTYTCYNQDIMNSYYGISEEQVFGVCKYYQEQGFEQYSYYEPGENISATYTKDEQMVHIYWIKCEKRLTIITSQTQGSVLPPKTPDIRTGNVATTITQVKSPEENGMGYVLQLADGSFVIYDGGHDTVTEEFWRVLKKLTPKGKTPLIRAWIITHSHGDHYEVIHDFSQKYADKVKLEKVLVSTASDVARGSNDGYLSTTLAEDIKAFEGAEICYVYTGMVFTVCNLRIEILMTHEDAYYTGMMPDDFNNTSIISRIFSDDYGMILLGDAGNDTTEILAAYYGDYLRSDMCQISHHGVEDCPLIVYRHIRASVLWYPCDTHLYNLKVRDKDVRDALAASKYTKEIILHDEESVTKKFGGK